MYYINWGIQCCSASLRMRMWSDSAGVDWVWSTQGDPSEAKYISRLSVFCIFRRFPGHHCYPKHRSPPNSHLFCNCLFPSISQELQYLSTLFPGSRFPTCSGSQTFTGFDLTKSFSLRACQYCLLKLKRFSLQSSRAILVKLVGDSGRREWESGMSVFVDFLLKECTRFEGKDFAGVNGQRLPGLRIAPVPVSFLCDIELAEAGNFDCLPGRQSLL